MNFWKNHIEGKIVSAETAAQFIREWQQAGDRVVFTNGCFDLLHFGHVHYLAEARSLGQRLVIGLNSDHSVRRLKGPARPINDEMTRQAVLASLACVDLVVVFPDDTPYELIRILHPDVLVKGGDWLPEDIVGSDLLASYGGKTMSLPYVEGYSTTRLEDKIRGSK